MIDVIDLYAGLGGFTEGFTRCGFNVKYAIDKWIGCKETYEANHPNTEFILKDIRELNPEDFKGKVKIVIGSPPCTEFSKGKINPDVELGMEFVNIYRKWIDVIKPEFWIMENVAHIRNHISKNDYPMINVLNCAHYGVPQSRERCFSGFYLIPRPTHAQRQSIDLFGNKLKKWVTLRESLKNYITFPDDAVLTDQMGNKPMSNSPYFSPDMPSRTITSVGLRIVHKNNTFDKRKKNYDDYKVLFDKHKDMPTINIDESIYRELTPEELSILQSFPKEYIVIGSKANKKKMIANAVPPLMSFCLASAIKKRLGE